MTSPPARFSTLYNFSLYIRFTCSCINPCVCARICRSVRDILCLFVFVCACVCACMGLGGMNPNEIFYGPVDLLIVPQVLSLLTPNLLETTCWAWFFSQSPLLLVLFFILFSSSSFLKVTSRFRQFSQTSRHIL